MSTSRDSCCLPSVKKQKHDFQVFTFVQCIIKQLLDSVFVISRIIKVSLRVISLSLRLRLITLTSTLIILDITKTSSNNCLLHVSTLTVVLRYVSLRTRFCLCMTCKGWSKFFLVYFFFSACLFVVFLS